MTEPPVIVAQLIANDPDSWTATCCVPGCDHDLGDPTDKQTALERSNDHIDHHLNQEAAMTVMATEPITEGFFDNIPEAAYHSDRSSLSVSGAKLLLKAPALYKHRLDNPEHNDAFDFGTAAHALVLGIGAPIKVVEADDWRTKAAQDARDEARANGETPLLVKDYRRVVDMADVLSSHTLAMSLLSSGRPEVSAYCVDEPTGVMRRGRFDWLGETILTDYKTAASSEPAAFAKAAATFGYAMQASWYLDLAADLGHPAQAFAFIVQEKTAPYLVSVVELDEYAVQRGRELNRRALERFRDCTETGLWPGYVRPDDFARVSLPRWFFYDDEVTR